MIEKQKMKELIESLSLTNRLGYFLLEKPLFLKKFLILYNWVFLYSTLPILEKIFTNKKINSLNCQEFEKIFKNVQFLIFIQQKLN